MVMKVVERRRKRLGSGPSQGGDYHHRDGEYHPRGENIITGRGKEWKYARVGLCHRPLPGQVGETLGRELGKWRSGALVLVDQPAPCLCGGLLTTKDKQTRHKNTK